MRPPAHSPVPPLLLLLSCPRGIYRCVQLLLLLLLLLIVSGGTARAGRGRRPTSVSPDLLPPWLVGEQVSNMSREFHDSWGVCGHRREQQAPQEQQVCQGHVHLRHHGRGHCGGGHHHSDHLAQRVCHHGTGRARRQHLRKLRAPNCGPWTNTSHWGREVAESSEKCFQTMRHLLHMDDLAGAAACRYSSILARYDCRGSSSFLGARLTPHHSMCDLCQEAYRYWVCSQLFPYYNHNGERVKPCRSFCHEVEQKCPYFLPKYKPVAGEPTFLCQGKDAPAAPVPASDPDIGELSEQESSYGAESCCYHMLCGRGHGSPAGVPRPHASPDHLHHLRLHPHHHRRRRLIHHHLLRRQRRRWKRVP
ncbi:uncharacterized protein LOC123510942 isoform X2 [Portunus trituberculatus]|uniref:uncharacterized protein LOC123510942 isoform X2 n=1 Tax=Portunus trituberculatus TaxID=210409 RepID=UPI001E1D1484|nr:uncharacterized protein LOC123510942 isoform X2 [Portunus trituberculatus]